MAGLISVAVRNEVVEALSVYSLADIRQLFATEDFVEPAGFEVTQGRMRRSLAEAIQGDIDFTSHADVTRYLRVIERLLEMLEYTASSTEHPWARNQRTKILRELVRSGVSPDADGRLFPSARLATSPSLAAAPTESGIRLAIAALERSNSEPEERVGAAKELVEATIKLGMDQLGETYGTEDLGQLAKKLHGRLRVDPAGIAPTTKGADTIVRLLGGLINIPSGLAELRNAGYGTGHGHSKRIAGIKARHADLASRAAVAYASFILETLSDPDAPWRLPREAS